MSIPNAVLVGKIVEIFEGYWVIVGIEEGRGKPVDMTVERVVPVGVTLRFPLYKLVAMGLSDCEELNRIVIEVCGGFMREEGVRVVEEEFAGY